MISLIIDCTFDLLPNGIIIRIENNSDVKKWIAKRGGKKKERVEYYSHRTKTRWFFFSSVLFSHKRILFFFFANFIHE